MQKRKAARNKKIVLYSVIAVFLAATAVALFIKRDSVKSIFTNDTPNQAAPIGDTTVNPITDAIDYSPSTPDDNAQINAIKNNADKNPEQPVNTNLTATITNTRVVNATAQVSVLVGGTTTGNCVLTLSKSGSSDVQKTVSIIVRNGIATCEDFNIPVSSLSNGSWNANIVLLFGQTKSKPAEGTLQVGS